MRTIVAPEELSQLPPQLASCATWHEENALIPYLDWIETQAAADRASLRFNAAEVARWLPAYFAPLPDGLLASLGVDGEGRFAIDIEVEGKPARLARAWECCVVGDELQAAVSEPAALLLRVRGLVRLPFTDESGKDLMPTVVARFPTSQGEGTVLRVDPPHGDAFFDRFEALHVYFRNGVTLLALDEYVWEEE